MTTETEPLENVMPSESDSINTLCIKLIAAKDGERVMREARIAIEEQLIALMGEMPEEGSVNVATDLFATTVSCRMNRKLDVAIWDEIAETIPREHWPVKEKLVIDVKKLKQCAVNHPDIYRAICKAVSAEPAKRGVKVEPVETLQ